MGQVCTQDDARQQQQQQRQHRKDHPQGLACTEAETQSGPLPSCPEVSTHPAPLSPSHQGNQLLKVRRGESSGPRAGEASPSLAPSLAPALQVATWPRAGGVGASSARRSQSQHLAVVGIAQVGGTGAGVESGVGAGLGSGARLTVGGRTAWSIAVPASCGKAEEGMVSGKESTPFSGRNSLPPPKTPLRRCTAPSLPCCPLTPPESARPRPVTRAPCPGHLASAPEPGPGSGSRSQSSSGCRGSA